MCELSQTRLKHLHEKILLWKGKPLEDNRLEQVCALMLIGRQHQNSFLVLVCKFNATAINTMLVEWENVLDYPLKLGKWEETSPARHRVLAKTIRIEYVHALLRQVQVYTFILSAEIDAVLWGSSGVFVSHRRKDCLWYIHTVWHSYRC